MPRVSERSRRVTESPVAFAQRALIDAQQVEVGDTTESKSQLEKKRDMRPVLSLAQGMTHWSLSDVISVRSHHDVIDGKHDSHYQEGSADEAIEVVAAVGNGVHDVTSESEKKIKPRREKTKDARATEFDRYGPVTGHPPLRELVEQLDALEEYGDVGAGNTRRTCVVTAGSNQAFVTLVVSTLDTDDECLLLSPYFFNHKMALELCGVTPVEVPCDMETLLPNFKALKQMKQAHPRARMLVMSNPSNPSGVVFPKSVLEQLVEFTKEHDMWFCCDEAYREFVYDADDNIVTAIEETTRELSPRGAHVIVLRTLSKFYGGAGWRIGFLLHDSGQLNLAESLAKAQDTIPINASQISQRVAFAALANPSVLCWASKHAQELKANRQALWNIISQTGGTPKTYGGLYFLVKLPNGVDDHDAVRVLARDYRILVLSGKESGLPGYLRVSYGNLQKDECAEAARRLETGLAALAVAGGRSQLS